MDYLEFKMESGAETRALESRMDWFYNKINTPQPFFVFFERFKNLLRATKPDPALLTAAATPAYRRCHSQTALR